MKSVRDKITDTLCNTSFYYRKLTYKVVDNIRENTWRKTEIQVWHAVQFPVRSSIRDYIHNEIR